jgi:cytochrome c553
MSSKKTGSNSLRSCILKGYTQVFMPESASWKVVAGVVTASALVVLTVAIPSFEVQNNSQGQAKAGVCAPCHGADGNSVSAVFPRLAGQHASYLATALNNYRSGARQNAVMGGIAKSLKDDDIVNLANYFESLPGRLSTLPRH